MAGERSNPYSALAFDYQHAVRAAETAPVAGEPEAQLTIPVGNLFRGVAEVSGLGKLTLVRETRLDRTRPDFAVLHTQSGKTHQKGYIELKQRDVSVDASTWRGRNAQQWLKMRIDAEILIVCNGAEAQLYRHGEPVGSVASLPYEDAANWQEAGLVKLLGDFLALRPAPVTNVLDLSARLAARTADLRDRLLWLLDQTGEAAQAAQGGYRSWRQHVYQHASIKDFADGVSQVVAYGMVLAALTPGGADADADGHISVSEARVAVRRFSPVLAAAFAPLIDKPVLFRAVQVELGALETLISAIEPDKVSRTADRRGDPWLYFYEDFLEIYDPEERRQAGVYYTPIDVVAAMVRITDHLLADRFGKRLGFADPSVVTLDPATGTGTFPIAVMDRAVVRATAARGTAGERQAAANLADNLFAFELLPGPYSVAHLRLSQRLAKLSEGQVKRAQVILTDTLESPLDPPDPNLEFGDAEVLAAEQNRAKDIKLNQRVTVVIGNPPYRRVERDLAGRGSGGWLINDRVPGRAGDKSLFDDILDVAKANTIFSHHASLYNLYVYFWRWAIWKAFEAHGDGPAIVSFITASSWLHGPGFVGLRQIVREICDEAWVLDLGGEGQGTDAEENIFAIETPVAVVTLVRDGATDRTRPATVHYRRIKGSAAEKLKAMGNIAKAQMPLGGEWDEASGSWTGTFVPSTGDLEWEAMPLLTDLFPWQQPGCKFGRTWPIGPDDGLLKERWQRFVGASPQQKPELFATASTGRTVETRVAGLPPLATLGAGDEPGPVIRYGFRSFDRQWTFDDPRLAALERPSLWRSLSDRQIFLCSLLTGKIAEGPALTASAEVPDLHFFRGNYGGKDIIPIWRDAAATKPNMTHGLAALLGKVLGIAPPSVEDLAAYVYALLSSSAYQQRFAVPLQTAGLRVPLTASRDLWNQAVAAGRELLWLHSYATRFQEPGMDRGRHVPLVDGIGWDRPVTTIPQDMGAIAYDEESGTLVVGDGQIGGVRADVWAYQVSGMPVLRKWLGYRTAKGTGRAASSSSELDRIRPTTWADAWNDELLDLIRVLTLTLDRQNALAGLLDRVREGPLIPASNLPVPAAAERDVPV